jgi:hypothetical protein
MRRQILIVLETDLPQSLLLDELQKAIFQLQASTDLTLILEGLSEVNSMDLGPCDG